jgi:hypothetical protein
LIGGGGSKISIFFLSVVGGWKNSIFFWFSAAEIF